MLLTGVVSGSRGEPIAGARVSVAGRSESITTDDKGAFSIESAAHRVARLIITPPVQSDYASTHVWVWRFRGPLAISAPPGATLDLEGFPADQGHYVGWQPTAWTAWRQGLFGAGQGGHVFLREGRATVRGLRSGRYLLRLYRRTPSGETAGLGAKHIFVAQGSRQTLRFWSAVTAVRG